MKYELKLPPEVCLVFWSFRSRSKQCGLQNVSEMHIGTEKNKKPTESFERYEKKIINPPRYKDFELVLCKKISCKFTEWLQNQSEYA